MSRDLKNQSEETALELHTLPELRSDRRWAFLAACAVMAITLLPYLFGYTLLGARPALGVFSWFTFNATDNCVYLSWMRQAADGHFFQHNLFTTDPQSGHQFNLFFLALGNLARLTHLPVVFVFHAARVLLGVVFLRAVWWLLEMLVAERRARRVAFLVVALSAGFGWVPGLWERPILQGPADTWQPEAVTFLSLYLFPLFIVSLLLMIGVLGWLLVAERTQTVRPAVYAGLCGLLLGNIHTYDVITLTAVWSIYLAAKGFQERRFDAGAWGRAIVAGVLTLISTGYTAYLLKTETVFAQRAAVETLSPSPIWYILGFGGVLLLALYGAFRKSPDAQRPTPPSPSHPFTPSPLLFLIVWAVMNIAVAYLPHVAFQRKMLMGAHIPLAILAGLGLTALTRRLEGRQWSLAIGITIVFLFLTNLRFMGKNMAELPVNKDYVRSYMYAGEVAALDWLREHAPEGVAIQPLPWVSRNPDNGRIGFTDNTVACFAPGLTGHPVNAGHWGETPDFGKTMGRWAQFVRSEAPEEYRQTLLRETGVRYILFTQKHDETGDETIENSTLSLFRSQTPPGLRLIPEASNADADVYEVIIP